MLRGNGPRRRLLRRHQGALCCSCRLLRTRTARSCRTLRRLQALCRLQVLCRLEALHCLEVLLCLQTLLRLQVLQRLVSQVQLVLLYYALLHYALLHFDVLVYGKLMDWMEGCRGSGVRRGEPLTLHLRTLKRFVQPLHRYRALAEVIHGCGWACRPSRVTPASTDCSGDSEDTRAALRGSDTEVSTTALHYARRVFCTN